MRFVAEIEQEADLEPGGLDVIQQLRFVRGLQNSCTLQFDNYSVIHNQVGSIDSTVVPLNLALTARSCLTWCPWERSWTVMASRYTGSRNPKPSSLHTS